MFDLKNILSYANANIQIIGIFIAIIGGLVATKLLNAKIEKDTLKEKLNKLKKEIDFNNQEKNIKEDKVFLKNKSDYIHYIHEKLFEDNFDINNYDDYGLSIEQRNKIIDEIKITFNDALNIFSIEHKKADVPDILKQNHIQENTIKYELYEYIGYKTGKNKKLVGPYGTTIPDYSDFRFENPVNSIPDEFAMQKLNENINEINSAIRWKTIEKEDIDSKIKAINDSLNIKKDVILFISITLFGIIVPQIVLSIYPIFINYKWLKYVFAIYSIMTFIISMLTMLLYIYRLYKNIKKDD